MRNLQDSEIGNYKLVRLLGKGGFAEVWLGTHVHLLNTRVAVKVLHDPSFAIDKMTDHDPLFNVEQFKREAQIIQNLAHPNIVKILDFGIEKNINIPYLIMEYAPYGTLRQRHPKGQAIPLPTIIPYVEQVSNALQYAHNKQVIHRDVKPENMLLGLGNQVLLSDFGIATKTPSARTPGRREEVAGTRGYMAPEQMDGEPVPQSDQYSLGVVVYEWLTGSLPSMEQINGLGVKRPNSTLGKQLPEISSEVEDIVLRALANKPEDRFESIQAFASALKNALLSGLTPVHIPHHAVGTTLCTYSEHKGGIYAIVWLSNGRRIASAGDDHTVQSWDASSGSYVVTYREHSQRVAGLASSRNGQYLSSASYDKTVQTREIATGRPVCMFGDHKGPVNTVSWSPDGRRLASGANDRTVRISNVPLLRDQISVYQGHTRQVNAVSWSPDGGSVASGSHDQTVQIWSADSCTRSLLYPKHTSWVLAVSWSPDGRLIASAGSDKTLQVWSAVTGEQVLVRPNKNVITSVSWSPDSRRLAFGSLGQVDVWDVYTKSRSFTYHGHKNWVRAVAWSPDGTKIASAGDDHTVQVWSIA